MSFARGSRKSRCPYCHMCCWTIKDDVFEWRPTAKKRRRSSSNSDNEKKDVVLSSKDSLKSSEESDLTGVSSLASNESVSNKSECSHSKDSGKEQIILPNNNDGDFAPSMKNENAKVTMIYPSYYSSQENVSGKDFTYLY